MDLLGMSIRRAVKIRVAVGPRGDLELRPKWLQLQEITAARQPTRITSGRVEHELRSEPRLYSEWTQVFQLCLKRIQAALPKSELSSDLYA
jgi:hypothetical protein